MITSFIIVTYNSQRYLCEAIESIFSQTKDNYQIIIVDNNSDNTDYLNEYLNSDKVKLFLLQSNLGYCGGNNFGINQCFLESSLIIIMNPDIILPTNFLMKVDHEVNLLYMKKTNFGVIGSKLVNDLGRTPHNFVDSSGIFQTWYGKWYDRGQGEIDCGLYDSDAYEEVPAICGALMVLNPLALAKVRISKTEYFKEKFFMYKEDIDLSLRISKAGFGVFYFSKLTATHIRGWKSRREQIKKFKIMSAKNELKINEKLGIIKKTYSKLKLLMVKLGY